MIEPLGKQISASPAAGLISWQNLLNRFLVKAAVDRPVMLALLGRSWQILAGPITLLLIAQFFTPEEQGFYYTFASLLAMQSIIELGFSVVIINVASHEWAHLSLSEDGRIVGELHALSRLINLGRFAFKWYAFGSLIFMIGVGIAGFVFLSQSEYSSVQWEAPWFALVALTGFLLWGTPLTSILEGCNQVETINKFRLSQAVMGSIAFWLTLGLGGGLWAAVVSAGANLLRDLYLILVEYRKFFTSFLRVRSGTGLNWRNEVLPMQWRLAVAGLVHYIAFYLFSPVMFHYHGVVVAGQMGMTWQVVSGLQMASMAWIQPNVPRFGILVARRDYAELDRVWLRTTLVSLIFLGCLAVVAWGLVYTLNVFHLPLAQRLLAPLPTGLLLLGGILFHVSQCESIYLRAHKREVLMLLSVTSSLLIGALVWWLGSQLGPTAAASAYFGVATCYVIPLQTLIWFRCRTKWHERSG